jgi:hypothetical protein
MSRNLKKQFEAELNCELMAGEEELFWTALNPVSTLFERREAEEKLFDRLKARGVKVE